MRPTSSRRSLLCESPSPPAPTVRAASLPSSTPIPTNSSIATSSRTGRLSTTAPAAAICSKPPSLASSSPRPSSKSSSAAAAALLKVVLRSSRGITLADCFTAAGAARVQKEIDAAKEAGKEWYASIDGNSSTMKTEGELSVRGFLNRVAQGCVTREWKDEPKEVQKEWEE